MHLTKEGIIWPNRVWTSTPLTSIRNGVHYNLVLHHSYRESEQPVHSIQSKLSTAFPLGSVTWVHVEHGERSCQLLSCCWCTGRNNGQDIMDFKGHWQLRWEALSRPIHFEHVPLEGRTENLKKNIKTRQKEECLVSQELFIWVVEFCTLRNVK